MREENYSELHIPQFTLADRLRKAMSDRGVTVYDMADFLGMQRETVSRYRNGGLTPGPAVIRAWSLKTQTDLHWLRTGKVPDAD